MTSFSATRTALNKWDSIIDKERLWRAYERIIKPNGAVILFGQDKFTAEMILSNEKLFRYCLIWQKTQPVGFLNAGRRPLKAHEDIIQAIRKIPNRLRAFIAEHTSQNHSQEVSR